MDSVAATSRPTAAASNANATWGEWQKSPRLRHKRNGPEVASANRAARLSGLATIRNVTQAAPLLGRRSSPRQRSRPVN